MILQLLSTARHLWHIPPIEIKHSMAHIIELVDQVRRMRYVVIVGDLQMAEKRSECDGGRNSIRLLE